MWLLLRDTANAMHEFIKGLGDHASSFVQYHIIVFGHNKFHVLWVPSINDATLVWVVGGGSEISNFEDPNMIMCYKEILTLVQLE